MTESEVLDVRIGDEHVTPEQIMDVNIGTYGPGDYVLPTGKKLEAQLLSNNSVRIFDGAMVYCGVRDVIAVNNYHDVTVENGQQGMNRNDIIVRHFEKSEETQFGSAEYQVIKGTATSGDASDPEITDTDLRTGALTHNMKLYRVKLEGLNVVAVEQLFETLPSIPELNGKMKWKLLQSITGSGVITLPDNYDELLAIAIADSTDNYSKYSVQIPHDLLSAQQEWHRFKAGSYSSTAYNSEAVVRVKEDSMQLASFYINGANRVDTCGLRVYYR